MQRQLSLLAVPPLLRSPELLILVPFVLIFLTGVLAGLPINLPDGAGLRFAERHYFRPLLLALCAQVIVLAIRPRLGQARLNARLALALTSLVAVSTWLHFNFKAWMPLVHGRLFDEPLSITDAMFGPLIPACIQLRRAIAFWVQTSIGYDIDKLYHDGFVFMFFLSFTVHAVVDRQSVLRRLVLASTLILLCGGVAYWLMPAKGPFVYRLSENILSRYSQFRMNELFDQVVATGQLPAGYFVAPAAAMPSLHTAHTLLFTRYAALHQRWLLIVYVPLLAWILLEAMAASWHYFLDLPAGALLCLLCMRLARRLLPMPEEAVVSPTLTPADDSELSAASK